MNPSLVIDISQLRVGMYIQLDLGWMRHPFAVSSFRVASEDQIHTLRSLGLQEVRYVPGKSDPQMGGWPVDESAAAQTPVLSAQEAPSPTAEDQAQRVQVAVDRRAQLTQQNAALAACDQRFSEASKGYQHIERVVLEQPAQARCSGDALVEQCVSELLDNGDSVIRLLSEGVGESNHLHAVNVMVLSLLLGRSLGFSGAQLQELGMAALVHDIGKLRLPAHLRQLPVLAAGPGPDRERYEAHVGDSVTLALQMGLPESVLTAIAQHHEMVDGTGFPLRLTGADLSRHSHVLALVNHYDRMCNPTSRSDALTPHEALSVIFAQLKGRFDSVVLGAFIRMMGVYPPGSIVQLINDRYAIVASVNSSRPLRPKVIVHDPSVPKEEAPILDLETVPELGIRRSLKPAQLPRDALDYLSPRQRICYFFERAVVAGGEESPA